MSGAGPIAGVVSPNDADADLALEVLALDGIGARKYPSLREAALGLDEHVGCLIIVEEALVEDDLPALREALGRLPRWSDLPLILVARDVGALGAVAGNAFPSSGNVTLLERPINPHTLVSAAQVALRAAARQREVGELINQREHAVKLRDEFLAMLAHELRNPLAPMRNALYLMRTVERLDPLVAQVAEIMDRQVGHIVRMVDDLMDVARLERGKVVLQKQPIELNRAVAAALETCLPMVRDRGHDIRAQLAPDALPIDADPVRIEQIVCNLVNNAAKFSPAPGDIRVATGRAGEHASITVEDRGIGFEASARDKLFDPFLQVNPTLERSAGGLGMGLTIVKRLAELHGGTVSAESEGPGKGARFTVRLPLSAAVAGERGAAAAPAPRGLRRRVVVIEDNPDIRDTLRSMATLWGHEVQSASDGASGLDLVLRERPDVALIDVGLPRLNGYDVARAIRKVIPNGEIRLIAITGYGQPSDREQALSAGFDVHVLKPVAPELLERLLAG